MEEVSPVASNECLLSHQVTSDRRAAGTGSPSVQEEYLQLAAASLLRETPSAHSVILYNGFWALETVRKMTKLKSSFEIGNNILVRVHSQSSNG